MEVVGLSSARGRKRPASCVDQKSGFVATGFPSPADDYKELGIDLNKELIPHPTSTFFLRVSGKSMKQIGIHNEDILIVDRSLNPKKGSVVIAVVNGKFTVNFLNYTKGVSSLEFGENQQNKIKLNNEEDIYIWGVVTHSIHQLRPIPH